MYLFNHHPASQDGGKFIVFCSELIPHVGEKSPSALSDWELRFVSMAWGPVPGSAANLHQTSVQITDILTIQNRDM